MSLHEQAAGQPPVTLSIVIVNWNTRALLQQCIECIRSTLHRHSCEIIVVDNGSTDGSPAFVRSTFPDVLLLENQENVGFAYANNQGFRIASGRYAMMLNSDAFVGDGTLDGLVDFLDAHPDTGVAAPRLENRDGTLQPSWASFPSLWSEIRGRNVRKRQGVPAWGADVYETDWLGGAALVIRRTLFDAIGYLDQDIFMYTEETDFCYRAKRAGWRVAYLDGLSVVHLGGGSASRTSERQLQLLYESKLYYFRKHHGWLRAELLRAGLLVGLGMGSVRRALGLVRSHAQQTQTRESIQARLQVMRHVASWRYS